MRLYLDTDGAAVIAPASGAVSAAGGRLTAVGLGEPTLEDVFISLTGRDLR